MGHYFGTHSQIWGDRGYLFLSDNSQMGTGGASSTLSIFYKYGATWGIIILGYFTNMGAMGVLFFGYILQIWGQWGCSSLGIFSTILTFVGTNGGVIWVPFSSLLTIGERTGGVYLGQFCIIFTTQFTNGGSGGH